MVIADLAHPFWRLSLVADRSYLDPALLGLPFELRWVRSSTKYSNWYCGPPSRRPSERAIRYTSVGAPPCAGSLPRLLGNLRTSTFAWFQRRFHRRGGPFLRLNSADPPAIQIVEVGGALLVGFPLSRGHAFVSEGVLSVARDVFDQFRDRAFMAPGILHSGRENAAGATCVDMNERFRSTTATRYPCPNSKLWKHRESRNFPHLGSPTSPPLYYSMSRSNDRCMFVAAIRHAF